MKLYVARHGQTQWNVENRICGRTDLPLTEEGLSQAKLLAEKAAKLHLDRIISSPMVRARQTAGAVAEKCGLPVEVDERLIEQDFGIYEGRDRGDPGYQANKRQFVSRYPGGESLVQLAHRVYSFLDELREEQSGEAVLIVCHGGVCRAVRAYFQDMTNEEYVTYSEENAGIREYIL